MTLIDSHCHLEMPHFNEDRDEVVDRAVAAGVTRMITVGTTLQGARKALNIAEARPEVYVALGIHPHEAKTASPRVFDELSEMAASPRVVAWGEIGLDYHYDHSPRSVQRQVFAEQIRIARRLDLPLIIHTRKAEEDTLAVLEEEGGRYRGVVHCFSAGAEVAKKLVDMGFFLSFTGNITFKKEMPEHQVIREVGAERIFVETDSPYLSPKPHRGKRNEPARVGLVAEKIAQILAMPLAVLAEKTVANTLAAFPRCKLP